MVSSKKKYLKDYTPYPFRIDLITLSFSIQTSRVIVSSEMLIKPLSANDPLILNGYDLEMQSIEIDEVNLDEKAFSLTENELIIFEPPLNQFKLKIVNTINPFENSSLEGLYISGGMLITQCEAEGFRRICFHPDRPDVLSRYTVSIEADLSKYPVLLSNGNQVSTEIINDKKPRHKITWEDPIPKPSYLFAMVAGELKEVNDQFITKSGKNISLRIHVEDGDQNKTLHAMNCLKRAMLWEESSYGLEYDLDEFNIVAVRHFNMGAMENKSLNIFNSKLVLADEKNATDQELERIESVIAHEYFHNWTGNRVTCRDWFQLSLKEGLTVYRDQCFTADLHSEPVKRIEDVSYLRNSQFIEDKGPTAHAVKPIEYIAIDNFYTTTIYEKGAEIIRMINTLVGDRSFKEGFNSYISKFDGTAATTEDFVIEALMPLEQSQGNHKFTVEQFLLWYEQIGTPNITLDREWNADAGKLTIYFKQNNVKAPLVIPIKIALISQEGELISEKLHVLKDKKDSLTFDCLAPNSLQPSLSLFRGFSAPVTWDSDLSDNELITLLKYDNDHFARWDACQILMKKAILLRANFSSQILVEKFLINSLKEVIDNNNLKQSDFLSSLISVPGLSELESFETDVDPISLYKSWIDFQSSMGSNLKDRLYKLIELNHSISLDKWPKGKGSRKLLGIAWRYLSVSKDISIRKILLDAVKGDSMSLARFALEALNLVDCEETKEALSIFYDKWQDSPIILDTWFRLSASSPGVKSLSLIDNLLKHPKYDQSAPNAVRAIFGGFVSNKELFHSGDCSGYDYLLNNIIEIDQRNPILAARLIKVFVPWRNYSSTYRDAMYRSIMNISQRSLSRNTKEIVDLIIS